MTATPTPLRELIAKWRELADKCEFNALEADSVGWDKAARRMEERAQHLRECADELEASLSARDEAGAVHVFQCRRCPVSVESRWQPPDCPECGDPCELDVTAKPAAPPASGEAEAVDGPDAAWKQASSEVFSTPLSQVREKYGTGDLYKAIASRADELRATPPAASSGDGIESVRRAIEDYIAEMRCLAHTDWADLTNFVNAQFRRLAAVAPAGMVLVPMEILNRFPEINPSNYDHDDVCALNAWGVELVLATPPATAGKE